MEQIQIKESTLHQTPMGLVWTKVDWSGPMGKMSFLSAALAVDWPGLVAEKLFLFAELAVDWSGSMAEMSFLFAKLAVN